MGNDPYKYFRIESRELLDALVQGVLEIEKSGFNHGIINSLLRFAHTLKGASRVVKQMEIYKYSHEIENILVPFRDKKETFIPREIINNLLKLFDSIELQIQEISKEPPKPSSENKTSTLMNSVNEDSFNSVRVETRRMEELLFNISESVVNVKALYKEQLNGSSIEIVNRLERELTSALNRIHEIRLFPVSTIFPVLSRATRDAADALQKKVEIEFKGGETRIDGTVLRALRDSLLHMVRNSVAHGIEVESRRVELGKSRAGKILLSVEKRGPRVVFNCNDDGKGIDLEAIRQTALKRNLLTSDKALTLNLDEALKLILQGGFSTSSEVTEISGRGVGLDVVQNTISKLNGEMSVQSKIDQGTQIEIHVPVSIESISAIEVAIRDIIVMIPMDAIDCTLSINRDQIIHTSGMNSILFEEKSIPFFYLYDSYISNEIQDKYNKLSDKNYYRTAKKYSTIIPIMILSVKDKKCAFAVDRLERVTDIIVRPLPVTIKSHIVSGVTFDSEGNPQPVIDPIGLIESSHKANKLNQYLSVSPNHNILVIDDSLTTRMLEQNILERAGYEVTLSDSGIQGLKKVTQRKYGLIIVDLEMPDMNGFEFVENIKLDANLNNIPIVMLSSCSSNEDKNRAKKLGIKDYFVKGEFDEEKFLAKIKNIIG